MVTGNVVVVVEQGFNVVVVVVVVPDGVTGVADVIVKPVTTVQNENPE